MSRNAIVVAALSALVLSTPALTQEQMMKRSSLPEVCKTSDAMASKMEEMEHEGTVMDEGHMALLGGMGMMSSDMAMGMMAEDIDTAFICGMIPHHQGAIDMARAVIEHGDDPEAKAMAEKIIAAQEQEIKDMIAWLEKQ